MRTRAVSLLLVSVMGFETIGWANPATVTPPVQTPRIITNPPIPEPPIPNVKVAPPVQNPFSSPLGPSGTTAAGEATETFGARLGAILLTIFTPVVAFFGTLAAGMLIPWFQNDAPESDLSYVRSHSKSPPKGMILFRHPDMEYFQNEAMKKAVKNPHQSTHEIEAFTESRNEDGDIPPIEEGETSREELEKVFDKELDTSRQTIAGRFSTHELAEWLFVSLQEENLAQFLTYLTLLHRYAVYLEDNSYLTKRERRFGTDLREFASGCINRITIRGPFDVVGLVRGMVRILTISKEAFQNIQGTRANFILDELPNRFRPLIEFSYRTLPQVPRDPQTQVESTVFAFMEFKSNPLRMNYLFKHERGKEKGQFIDLVNLDFQLREILTTLFLFKPNILWEKGIEIKTWDAPHRFLVSIVYFASGRYKPESQTDSKTYYEWYEISQLPETAVFNREFLTIPQSSTVGKVTETFSVRNFDPSFPDRLP